MNFLVLNSVLTKYLNKAGTIDRLKDLKLELNYRIGCSGAFDVYLDDRIVIGYESEETYHKNRDYYEETKQSIFVEEEKKRQLKYNYDKAYVVRDFVYPAVVYRANDSDAIWIRNKTIHIFTGQSKNAINFGTQSEYAIGIDNFSKEDLFGIRLVSTIDFNEEALYDAINCYQLLKKQNLNILFDIREGKENK